MQLPLVKTIFRLLTFQLTEEEFEKLDLRFLGVGLLGTWLVGIGRYWDSPDAQPGQYLGLGSVVYVFALALLLYLAALPLRPANWSYRSVLTFITLTSFPAALYALPVEQWTSLEQAAGMNVAFLMIVAIYRVALYLYFMWRSAQLGIITSLAAVFLPISLIIGFLTLSGLSGRMVEIMGGLRDREATSMDGVNNVLTSITVFSCMSIPLWLIVYAVAITARNGMRGRNLDLD